MTRLDVLAGRIDLKCRDIDDNGAPAYVRFTKTDIVEAINEAKDIVVGRLLETRENILAFLSTTETPTDLDIPAGGERIVLPSNFARVIRVQILSGSDYITISERRRSEAQAGFSDLEARDVVYGDMEYEIIGPYLQLSRPVSGAVPAGVRLWHEHMIPDLLWGKATAGAASTITLASTMDHTSGQFPADGQDDIYNGLEIMIIAGVASGDRRTITDYVGSTRVATVNAAWSGTPNTTSEYVMFMPFRNLVASLTKMIDLRARIALLSDKRNEDVSILVTRYNELEETLLSALDNRTPGNRSVLPFDAAYG